MYKRQVLALAVALMPALAYGAPWMDWIYRALVLLVIACPCALVISTPVSIVSGLAAAARKGILDVYKRQSLPIPIFAIPTVIPFSVWRAGSG